MRARRSRARPRVSVIIASSRCPEALRLSHASAPEQTVADVEVLVIEDRPIWHPVLWFAERETLGRVG